jgi:hypothetical protein
MLVPGTFHFEEAISGTSRRLLQPTMAHATTNSGACIIINLFYYFVFVIPLQF